MNELDSPGQFWIGKRLFLATVLKGIWCRTEQILALSPRLKLHVGEWHVTSIRETVDRLQSNERNIFLINLGKTLNLLVTILFTFRKEFVFHTFAAENLQPLPVTPFTCHRGRNRCDCHWLAEEENIKFGNITLEKTADNARDGS